MLDDWVVVVVDVDIRLTVSLRLADSEWEVSLVIIGSGSPKVAREVPPPPPPLWWRELSII